MFKKLVAIEPINIFDIHKNKLNDLANKVILYQDIPDSDE